MPKISQLFSKKCRIPILELCLSHAQEKDHLELFNEKNWMHRRINYKESEDGFTLIEILVVVLIIGILSSIAIPVFLNQRKKANESALRSDLRNVAIAIENHFVEEPDDLELAFSDINFKASNGVTLAIRGNANNWCAVEMHNNSDFNNTSDTNKALTYDSTAGGIMPNGWNWHTKSKCETPETRYSWLYA